MCYKTKFWEGALCDITNDCISCPTSRHVDGARKYLFSRMLKINIVVGGYKHGAKWVIFCRFF